MPRWFTWPVLAVLFLLVFALGFWGFTRYQAGASGLDPVTTRLYLTLQLFVIESGTVRGELPWQLDVARAAAPLLAAYTVVQGLLVAFAEQLDGWRLRRSTGHVVVVGLGRRGRALCRDLLAQGRRVVGVDIAAEGARSALRAGGGLQIRGDGRLPDVLRRARVDRATHLVVLTGDDGITAEVVATAREVAASRSDEHPLRCVGLLADPELWTLLACQELLRPLSGGSRVDFVDAEAAGALALVRRYPPTAPGGVLVTGRGELAGRVLVALARRWGAQEGGPPAVAVLGATPEWLDMLAQEHPELDGLGGVARPTQVAEALRAVAGSVAYVCEKDDRAAVARTLELVRSLPGGTRIVVVQRHLSAVARLLGGPGPAGTPEVVTFGLLEEVCRPEVLLSGTTELLAQALHDLYLEERNADGTASPQDPASRPWDELPESLRASNRAHALDIAAKLRSVGRVIGPLADRGGARGQLSDDEVEELSRREHVRWVEERELSGWRPGARDPEQRTTPFLVPWDDLTEEVRDYDRLFVRRLPQVLAAIGLQILAPDPAVVDRQPGASASAQDPTRCTEPGHRGP